MLTEKWIGRYRILAKLGEGGMGTVYAARDERLERNVAIKTIRSEVASEGARKRMWREARAAAGLNHPNICQIYEVGETDGELYLAMELLDGESLTDRLAARSVTLTEALEITLEVLAALAVLHERGFVHRDLKPSNIFCGEHGIKLLDFGVVLPPEELLAQEGERLTRTGMMVGTPAFMAPEQWIGRDVDPRADLFAVGALLFEMIVAEPAFKGDNALDLYNAIVRDPAPTLTGSGAIEVVDRVVQRALSKLPADRPASAAAMATELETILPLVDDAQVVKARQVKRLLVPPLRLLKPDDEVDFLRESLADALVSSLSGREELMVKAGGARFVADGEPDLEAIAAETGVGMVLLGNILRAGSQIRVSVQLVQVPDGAVIWSDSRSGAMDDVFELQDSLARQIADSLALNLRAADSGGGQRDVPASGQAYEYYLRANQLSYNFGMLPAARDLYLAAVKEDPNFAPAWARLGRVYRVMAKYGQGDEENLARAEEAFVCALELNPDLPMAHNLFAYYEIEELGRPQDALLRLLRQARRAPTDPDLLAGLVLACRFCGLLCASIAADRRARRLDPSVATSVAYTHWMRGDYQAALLADDEDMRWIHHYSLPMLGREDEAIASCRQIEGRTSRPIVLDMLVSTRSALEQDTEACRASVQRVFNSGFHDPEGLYFGARNAIHVGELDLGHEILEKVVTGGLWCAEKLTADPWLEPLRADGRLEPLVALARQQRHEAAARYREGGGEALLGPLEPGATDCGP